jgi:hypothetical protein
VVTDKSWVTGYNWTDITGPTAFNSYILYAINEQAFFSIATNFIQRFLQNKGRTAKKLYQESL